jgi:hypothetical protein
VGPLQAKVILDDRGFAHIYAGRTGVPLPISGASRVLVTRLAPSSVYRATVATRPGTEWSSS